MASRIRNPDWQEDAELKQDLKRYILQNLSRREILDFVSRDYAQYAWSLGTLSRRLAYFDIKYIEYNTDLKEVEAALQSELQGPGQLLGYRSMQRKIREQHQPAVPRNLVYDLMTELDPDGLERRGGVGKRKHKRGAAGTFTSMVSVFFITADSSAHNLCSEIPIFFYLEVKPLDYSLHIVPVGCYVVDFSFVYSLLYSLKML